MRQQSLPMPAPNPAPPEPPPDPFAELLERAAEVCGEAAPTPLRNLVTIHTEPHVRAALAKIEAMDERPRNPWGLLVSILDGWRETGAVVKPPVPKVRRDPSSFAAREFMQNYNPGERIREPSGDEIRSTGELAQAIERASGGGIEARLARGLLRGWIATGRIEASEVPAGVLADEPSPAVRRPAPAIRMDSPSSPARPAANRFPAPPADVVAVDPVLRRAATNEAPDPPAAEEQTAAGAIPPRPRGRSPGRHGLIMPRGRPKLKKIGRRPGPFRQD